jgi:TetR/AcrR family transcriptional repressor of bet genes
MFSLFTIAVAIRLNNSGEAMQQRKTYVRLSEDQRKQALVQAALVLVAEGGFQAASVRAIADRAGVTAGLIRHYFGSKEVLMRQAYEATMSDMTARADAAASDATAVTDCPHLKISAYVATSLRPPVLDIDRVSLWAGFINEVRRDLDVRAVHRQTYFAFRDRLERLIADLPREATSARCRADAVACNGVIDGLWLEGSILSDDFAPGEIEEIGLRAVEAILGVKLPRGHDNNPITKATE